MPRALMIRGFAGAILLLGAGCSNMMDTELVTQLVSINPRGGAINVSTSPDLMLTFSGAMMPGMDLYVRLHRGGLDGPALPTSCSWSGDQRSMTCRPDQPLASGTRYTMHVGGGLMDADGGHVGMGAGTDMGGRWATGSMMGSQTTCTGGGWMHSNGSYGMAFEFTTR